MSFTSASAPGTPGERWSDVYLSVTARAVSTCGDFLAATALVLALQARGAGGYAVAALLLAAAVPPVVLAPITGRLADRVDSRVLLVAAGLGQAVVCAALAFVSQPALIIVLAALLAAGLAVTQPTLSALLPLMVTRQHLPKAAALGQTATTLGGLAAPILAGVLFGLFGARVPLLADAVSYLAITVLGLVLRTRRNAPARRSLTAPAVQPAGPATGDLPGVGQAGILVAGDPSDGPGQSGGVGQPDAAASQARWRLRDDALLRPLITLTGAVIAVVSAANVIEVFFLRGVLHASATVYGLASAVWMAAMMIGAWGLARMRSGDAGIGAALLGALALTCASIGAMAVVPAIGWVIPLYVVGGVTNGIENASLGALVGGRVPDAARGRAFALVGAAANGGNAAGYLLGGVLLAVIAVRPAIALVGVAGLAVTAVFAAPALRAIARERAAQSAPGVTPDVSVAGEPAGVS
jgi:MFS family permease